MIRNLLRFWTPHGLLELRRAAVAKAARAHAAVAREHFHKERRRVAKLAEAQDASDGTSPFTFRDAFSFLEDRGLDGQHLKEGTIPASSFEFLLSRVYGQEWALAHRPITALHVGNFVGISLAALASSLRAIHSQSVVIAVDPNVPHRGVAHPQDHALALLAHFGLLKNVLLLVGYSSSKSVSNDGVIFDNYDPVSGFKNETSCENVLENLARIIPSKIDLAVLDGNHMASYLRAEIEPIARLLEPGGMLALDDVDDAWSELKEVYRSLIGANWQDLGTDGRVGLLQAPQLAARGAARA